MSTSLRSSPDMRAIFLSDPSVDPLSLTTFVPGAILHAAELNGSFASVLPLTGGIVLNPSNSGGLGVGHGVTGRTVSVQYGAETFTDHFAKVFNTPVRPDGQFNNLESVLTIPAGNPSCNLTGAFGASVVDYGGDGALAGLFYATAGVGDAVLWGLNTVCTDSWTVNNNPGPYNNVREQNEYDFFVRNSTTTVRGQLVIISSTVPQLNAASWYAFATGVFPELVSLECRLYLRQWLCDDSLRCRLQDNGRAGNHGRWVARPAIPVHRQHYSGDAPRGAHLCRSNVCWCSGR